MLHPTILANGWTMPAAPATEEQNEKGRRKAPFF